MASRAEFLASLGISNADMANPDEQAGPAPPSRTKSGGGSSLLINRERSDPSLSQANVTSKAYSTHKASPVKGGASYSGTSAILSMAADSDDDEEVYRAKPKVSATSVRNATGSQEISSAPAPPPRATAGGYSGEYSSSSPSYSSSQPPQRQTSNVSSGSFTSSGLHGLGGAGAAPTSSFEENSSPSAAGGAKMTRAEKAKEADSQKLAGNAFFGEREYRKAVRCYSKAIEMDPSNAALYSNRSAAYLAGRDQMGIDTRSMALRDATRATELRPDWAKGYCRQAEALTELESFEEAVEAWTKALEYDPGNRNFEQRRAEVEDRLGPVKRTASSINNSMAMGPRKNPTSSANSGSYTNPSGESARTLAHRFHEQSGTMSGGDFRAEELEKARQRRSGNSFSTSSSTTTGANSATIGGVGGMGSSGYYSAARSVPQEYSTDAAREYQNSLLEAFRKKKAAQGK